MIQFSQNEVNSMTGLNFGVNSNKESRILLFGNMFSQKVLKRFINDNGPKFEDKLTVINELIENRDKFDSRFILPQELASIDGKTVGYVMDYIESRNLESLLNSKDVSVYQKLLLLKEVGTILEQCEVLRKKYKELSNFYIGDLHEGNFIYNKKTGCLNIVDLDGCKLKSANPCIIKYLDTSVAIKDMCEKYPTTKDGAYVPNKNSDLYCYVIMILNYLYQGNTQELSKEEFLNYIDFLSKMGINKELLDIFARVYTTDDNLNPVQLLDNINDFFVPYISRFEYQKRKAYIK